YQSNFFGRDAGNGAVNASDSSFLGYRAGYEATDATGSLFAGNMAGYQAYSAAQSLMVGYQAGYNASGTPDFLGASLNSVGVIGTSSFIGYQAGYDAAGAVASNFLGLQAGYEATNAYGSNFMGVRAGYGATNASSTNFVGYQAGYQAVDAESSNFFGNSAGYRAYGAVASLMVGYQAGYNASNTPDFLGPTQNASAIPGNSNFIGYQAGYDAPGAALSTFIGVQAGKGAIDALGSNFIGYNAGEGALNAAASTFIGNNAGGNATNARDSIFMGNGAGRNATGAFKSVFLGPSSGAGASAAPFSTYIGFDSGAGSTNAANSIFLGHNAGWGAPQAANSIFIGGNTGLGDTVNNQQATVSYTGLSGQFSIGEIVQNTNTGRSFYIFTDNGSVLGIDGVQTQAINPGDQIVGSDSGATATVTGTTNGSYSIVIGPEGQTAGYANSISLGAFTRNSANNQLMIGSNTFPINEVYIQQTGGTNCTITSTGISCTSDENLKTNITDLSNNILDSLSRVRTVTYNWKSSPGSNQMIGFLAQDLEQYFPQLVTTDKQGQKSVNYANMTPVLVEAIRELNVKLATIQTTAATVTDHTGLVAWFADAANGIGDLFVSSIHAKNEVCIDDVCVTKADLQTLVNQRTGAIPVVPQEGGTTTDTTSSTGSSPESTSPEQVIEDTSSDPVPAPQPVPEPVVPAPDPVIDPVTQ
ncbi:MAG: tail fiber domain-containing protein, partial [bacterium]